MSALAARLLHYELEGGLGIFNNASKTYADILGAAGRAAWRSLLVREWTQQARSTASAPPEGAPPPLIDHRRFQVQMLMERLANSEGDLDALLALKRADLRGVRDHVALAEWLESIDRHEEALLCGEEASRRFTGTDERRAWRAFLIGAYQRAGRHEAALLLAWEEFEETGDLERFRDLKSLVHDRDPAVWPEWRDRALAWLRAQTAEARCRSAVARRTAPVDASREVEILLAEHLDDEAWRAAAAGGCRSDLWLVLAARREVESPDDALEIYGRQIDRILTSAGSHDYREALELIGRTRTLLLRSQREPDYARYLAGLRSTYRKKRTFLRLLGAAAT